MTATVESGKKLLYELILIIDPFPPPLSVALPAFRRTWISARAHQIDTDLGSSLRSEARGPFTRGSPAPGHQLESWRGVSWGVPHATGTLPWPLWGDPGSQQPLSLRFIQEMGVPVSPHTGVLQITRISRNAGLCETEGLRDTECRFLWIHSLYLFAGSGYFIFIF